MRRTGDMSPLRRVELGTSPSGRFSLVENWGLPAGAREALDLVGTRRTDSGGATAKALELAQHAVPSIRLYAVADSVVIRSETVVGEDLTFLIRRGFGIVDEWVSPKPQPSALHEVLRRHQETVPFRSIGLRQFAADLTDRLLEEEADDLLDFTGAVPTLDDDGDPDVDGLVKQLVEPALNAWEVIAQLLEQEAGEEAEWRCIALTNPEDFERGESADGCLIKLYVGKHRAVATCLVACQ